MASAAVTPRVRIMAICDSVRESRVEAGTYNLKRVRQEIIAPEFPFSPARLWLFLVLSSARSGKFPGYVVVVQDRTDKAIYFGELQPSPSFDTEHSHWATCQAISCTFPEEGRYSVQLWFFREEGSDVLKGEAPLIVSKGS